MSANKTRRVGACGFKWEARGRVCRDAGTGVSADRRVRDLRSKAHVPSVAIYVSDSVPICVSVPISASARNVRKTTTASRVGAPGLTTQESRSHLFELSALRAGEHDWETPQRIMH